MEKWGKTCLVYISGLYIRFIYLSIWTFMTFFFTDKIVIFIFSLGKKLNSPIFLQTSFLTFQWKGYLTKVIQDVITFVHSICGDSKVKTFVLCIYRALFVHPTLIVASQYSIYMHSVVLFSINYRDRRVDPAASLTTNVAWQY